MLEVKQNNLDLMFNNDFSDVNFAAGSCSCSCSCSCSSSAATIIKEEEK